MALVPWVYNNPRTIDSDRLSSRQFIFQGKSIEVLQDACAEITVLQNTALKLWDGAFLLARYLENTSVFPVGSWSGLCCIELGSGCGLVGVVAWLLGANVTLTDLPSATVHTRYSIETNVTRLAREDPTLAQRKAEIRVEDYSWGDEVAVACSAAPYDVILGSDIVYSADAAGCLVCSLKTLSSEKTLILLSYKRRNLGEELFFRKLAEDGFKYETVPSDFHPSDFRNSDYNIIRIYR